MEIDTTYKRNVDRDDIKILFSKILDTKAQTIKHARNLSSTVYKSFKQHNHLTKNSQFM